MSDPLTIIQGDALSSLRRLPDESVQTCVTSPPYWGLRDYGLEPIVWDETVECDHEWGSTQRTAWANAVKGPASFTTGKNQTDYANTLKYHGSWCQACGAWRGSLGLEPTPEMYASHIVQIFNELRRSLKTGGTLWLNLGDSYATGAGSGRSMGGDCFGKQNPVIDSAAYPKNQPNRMPIPGLKAKDLIGVPWRVAFGLQSAGWYLRSDIIWSKPNPMPESVTDRPTKSHEYIFLFSKSERYHYDHEAIKEPNSSNEQLEHNLRYAKPYEAFDSRGGPNGTGVPGNENNRGIHSRPGSGGRNRRSVWTVSTLPFPDAHFATFPPDLINPCILAGAPLGGVVIDPFAGSGTTGKVAIELGRKAILIEPKAEYVEMIKRRCQTTIGLPITA